jgi:hypothetical protein
MNHSQTATLLAMCAAYDQRTIGETDVTAWQAALDDTDPDDARTAVINWYKRTRDRIAVSDVRTGVATIRAARLPHIGAGMEAWIPDADPNDIPAYLTALRAHRAQLAAADQPQRYDPDHLAAGMFRRPNALTARDTA